MEDDDEEEEDEEEGSVRSHDVMDATHDLIVTLAEIGMPEFQQFFRKVLAVMANSLKPDAPVDTRCMTIGCLAETSVHMGEYACLTVESSWIHTRVAHCPSFSVFSHI